MEENMNSNIISIITDNAQEISIFILFATVIIIAIQAYLTRRSTYATVFKAVYDILQNYDIRKARESVLLQYNLEIIDDISGW
jgi:hypothetical protein